MAKKDVKANLLDHSYPGFTQAYQSSDKIEIIAKKYFKILSLHLHPQYLIGLIFLLSDFLYSES